MRRQGIQHAPVRRTVGQAKPIASAYLDELHKRVVYLAEEIENFVINQSKDQIVSVSIRTTAPMDAADLAMRVDRLVRVGTKRAPSDEPAVPDGNKKPMVTNRSLVTLDNHPGVVKKALRGAVVLWR